MKYLLPTLVVAFFAVIIYLRIKQARLEAEALPPPVYTYKTEGSLMTKKDRKFFTLLTKAFGAKYIIFPQVRLTTLFNHELKGQNQDDALRHIQGQAVNFVLCDKKSKPLLGIALNDPANDNEEQMQHDALTEQVFESANRPLVRFSDWQKLGNEEVAARLQEKL